jgi:dynactin-4
MVASNYLPEVELGRRRRRLDSGDVDQPMTPEEMERRRRERRRTRARGGDEEDEAMSQKLRAGDVVSTTSPTRG